METILVTGGAGFIGSAFVRQWLAEESARVVVLDKLTYAGNLDSLPPIDSTPGMAFVQGSIADRPLVARLLEQERPAAIVNFAAETHVDRSIDGPEAFVRTNVVGTYELLEAARRYWMQLGDPQRARFRFLQISTDEVYGSIPAPQRADETTRLAPNSPYSASKAAADHFVRAYHATYGLPVLTTNCSNNYGPYQFPEKLIPLVILNSLEGKPLPVYGDGLNVRDWLFVEDHCRALRCVLKQASPGETYNVGGDCELTNLEVVRAIGDTVDRLRPDLPHAPCRSLITFVTDRPGHDRRYAVDCSKIQRDLGWCPQTDFASGLERTVRWYIENTAWVERVNSGAYHRQRLGLAADTDEPPDS